MKKILYSIMALTMTAMTFTACEDVPEPYPTPQKGDNSTVTLPYTSANLNTGWTLQEVTTGVQPWSKGSNYAQATGYQAWDGGSSKTNKAAEGWLISPAFSTVGYENVKLSFNHTIRYTNNVTGWEANHKIYASTSFDGTNASTDWIELPFTAVASPYTDWTLYSSGEIQLPAALVGKEKVYIGFWFKAPANASTTWELQTFKIMEGIAEKNQEPDKPTEELGTAEAPLTVEKALEIINGYKDSGSSQGDAYVKGTIVSVQSYNDKYKSITYYISDDGKADKQLQVYSGKGLNGADFASKDDLKQGAVVVVKGQLKKFVKNNEVTPEINQSSTIISITNNEGNVTPTPQPDGKTIEAGKYFFVYTANGTQVGKPVEAGKDYGYIYLTDAKLSDGALAEDADNLFTFTATTGGFTIQDASGRYYYMDDSHNSFQVSASMPSSNHIWTVSIDDAGKATVKNVGTSKTIQYLSKYKEFTPTTSGDGLPQLLQVGAKVETSNQGEGEEVSGKTLTVVFADLKISDLNSAITLSDGTTLTYSQESGKNPPIYHTSTSIIRMYAQNSVTIKASKKIISVVFNYDTYQGTAYKGNDAMYGEAGGNKITPTKDDKTVTFNNVNANELKVVNDHSTNSGGTQFRCTGIVITYAE